MSGVQSLITLNGLISIYYLDVETAVVLTAECTPSLHLLVCLTSVYSFVNPSVLHLLVLTEVWQLFGKKDLYHFSEASYFQRKQSEIPLN